MNLPIEKSRNQYANGYYVDKLEQGLEFQDRVTQLLYQRGIVVIGYASRRFQILRGENMLGAEIKNDAKFRETGNLYIETAEKSHPDKPKYYPSGIHREDNSWLYVIGDINDIWIFSTKYLRMLESKYRKVETPTSQGFVMPLSEAHKYCVRHIKINEPGND